MWGIRCYEILNYAVRIMEHSRNTVFGVLAFEKVSFEDAGFGKVPFTANTDVQLTKQI